MKARKIKAKRANVRLHPGQTAGRAVRWTYGYADLALLLDRSEGTLRNRVMAGWEPTLEAICREFLEKHRREITVCRAGDK